MKWYYTLLARRPLLVLLATGVFSIACIVVSLTAKTLPDFTDPTLGFAARGTHIGKRLTAWHNLIEETRPSGLFVSNPSDLIPPNNGHRGGGNKYKKFQNKKKNRNKKKKQDIHNMKLDTKIKIIKDWSDSNRTIDLNYHEEFDEEDNDTMTARHEHWDYGRNLSSISEEVHNKRVQQKTKQWESLLKLSPPPPLVVDVHIPFDGYFCESPNKEFSHFVVERVNYNVSESMLEKNAMLAMCDLEQRLTSSNQYDRLCQKELTTNNCCRPWSLPNYIGFLTNKTSCYDIQEDDITYVKSLLQYCFEYYKKMKLSNDCALSKCNAPTDCTQNNAVYNIFHYLTDVDFMKSNESEVHLTAAMIFLPIARSSKALKYFHELEDRSLANELVAIVAIDMGLKNALFDESLLNDSWLFGMGCIFIMASMWLYTSSIFVTLMTLIAVVFSLGIAYFIYTLIFEFPFFPFMNLLAVVVMIGIGADDAFIFVKLWQCANSERLKVPATNGGSNAVAASHSSADSLSGLMGTTLRHAALSMLVTSATTSAAFFASFLSSITAIRCFGVFAGSAVMANYLLMITWLPATVSIAECFTCTPGKFCKQSLTKLFVTVSRCGKCMENFIIGAVLKMPKIWILLFGAIGITSGVLVLYWPRLRLPDSPDFKLFVSHHPFEVYDDLYKDRFWFEKLYTSSDTFKLPLRFVWGIQPVDDGNYLNPGSNGDVHLDNNFNISSPESQVWLLQFCSSLKSQPFYQVSRGLLLPSCFIQNFMQWMNRKCLDEMANIDRSPCCESTKFPFPPHIFDECLPLSISSLYETPREFFIPGIAGPKFSLDPKTNRSIVTALVVEYESNLTYTLSFTKMQEFTSSVEKWMLQAMQSAPPGMRNAWFTSELDFYDLQNTLSEGTLTAIVMSMGVALSVLLLVTLNVLISLYAIITVTLTIFTTVAVLVLMNWKLNVLESVCVSSAIGLAVDFSLHYGVQYRFSPEPDRLSSSRYALSRMLAPTSMAAVTTGLAGALMLPSNVLPYIQIGLFLVIVMMISWLYATFFLISLLLTFGPQYGFGQFRYPKIRKRDPNKKGQQEFNTRSSTQGTVSEQLLSGSSSAAGEMIGSESHELDSLNSNSVVKPASALESRPINFDRALKKSYSYPKEKSPSTVSAITVVLPDDFDSK